MGNGVEEPREHQRAKDGGVECRPKVRFSEISEIRGEEDREERHPIKGRECQEREARYVDRSGANQNQA